MRYFKIVLKQFMAYINSVFQYTVWDKSKLYILDKSKIFQLD